MLTKLGGDPVTMQYLAEGAANIVYKLILENNTKSSLQGSLLRLRKDLPTGTGVYESQISFETNIVPLFHPTEIVQQTLIRLPPTLISQLNAELRHLEANTSRPRKRCNTYLRENEEYGCLVPDMSARSRCEYLLELKPKWLAQSPSAPVDAIRCRTCALRARRVHGGMLPAAPANFCPLRLLASSSKQLAEILQSLVAQEVTRVIDFHAATKFLVECQLLSRLRDLQTGFDAKGIVEMSVVDEKMALAMTLRDCTLFLRSNSDGTFEARLGDLDLKSLIKAQTWLRVEQELIEEGWYTADRNQFQEVQACALMND